MKIDFIQKIINKLRNKENKTPKIKYKNIKSLLKNEKIIKLHIGCGTIYKEGWINIDNNSDNNIEKLDFKWDLRKPLPFPENSVDFIYNEHFFEHLTPIEAIMLFKNLLKILKPKGILRIAMPNLKDIVDIYLDDNWLETNKTFLHKFNMTYIKTKAELININFRNWGHKWIYDWEELERRLKEAGATNITNCKLNESTSPELCNLETRKESTLIAEVVKQ